MIRTVEIGAEAVRFLADRQMAVLQAQRDLSLVFEALVRTHGLPLTAQLAGLGETTMAVALPDPPVEAADDGA